MRCYLTISHRRRGDHKPIFTELRSSEVNDILVITDPEVTNCFSINSVLKNNNIYKRYKYNLLHSPIFQSNESSCRNLVARFCYFPVLNCQINCFRHLLKGAFVFRKKVRPYIVASFAFRLNSMCFNFFNFFFDDMFASGFSAAILF